MKGCVQLDCVGHASAFEYDCVLISYARCCEFDEGVGNRRVKK